MDNLDRRIINELQGNFPICERPFESVAKTLGTQEDELMDRISHLLDTGMLSRFGPMYHAERMGGALTLCAMQVPDDKFDHVTEQVNGFPEVAHNYARDHELNMWFVLATEAAECINEVIQEIAETTGLHVYNMPKLEEFFIGLKFRV